MPQSTPEATRIVVYDWNPEIVHISTRLLRAEGYEVFPTETIRDAEAQIAEHQPELVILEVSRPQSGELGEGFELLEKIRRSDPTNRIAVLVLTMCASDAAIYKLWMAGADTVIIKPLNAKEILCFVRKILEAPNDDDFEL